MKRTCRTCFECPDYCLDKFYCATSAKMASPLFPACHNHMTQEEKDKLSTEQVEMFGGEK